MSGALEQLIRLNRWKLDEKRRAGIELERLAERFREDIAQIEAELARERAAADHSLALQRAFPSYAERVRARLAKLEASLADVTQAIERVRDDIATAFRELKRYEIALGNRTAQRQAAHRRREQILSDEIGLTIHRRRS